MKRYLKKKKGKMSKINFSYSNFQRSVYPNLDSAISSLSTAQNIARNMDIPEFSEKPTLANLNQDLDSNKALIQEYISWSKNFNHKLDIINDTDAQEISDIKLVDVIQYK